MQGLERVVGAGDYSSRTGGKRGERNRCTEEGVQGLVGECNLEHKYRDFGCDQG